VDPIDGTANFIAGIPYFAVSLAREANGRIVEGYVYNPISEELYCATTDDARAYLNGKPIALAHTDRIQDSVVAFGVSANKAAMDAYYDRWRGLLDGCKKALAVIVPSLTLCNVARGRLDAFIDSACSMEGQAAASLILAKAGGQLRDYDLSPFDHTTVGAVAANPHLLPTIARR